MFRGGGAGAFRALVEFHLPLTAAPIAGGAPPVAELS